MKYLIYISSAKKLLNEAELLEILMVVRRNNRLANITGMLIYSNGTFIQVIEGEEAGIDALFRKIEKDTRHKNIIRLAEGALAERIFPDWSMAFLSVKPAALNELEGYINPLSPDFLRSDNPHSAITILKTFAENNRANTTV